MDVNICLESLIRLFFEIVRVLFGDVTLLWRGDYFESELPALISTLKWVFLFAFIAMFIHNQLMRKLLIVGIPAVFNFLIDSLSAIPFVGTFFSVGVGIVGAPIAALAWSFALWTDDNVHPLLRLFATPGIMVLAAVNAVQPISIVGDLGYAFAFAYFAEILSFLSIVFVGIIILFNPTFLCSVLNGTLVKWETIRYEGWGAAVFGCLVFIKNKAIKIR